MSTGRRKPAKPPARLPIDDELAQNQARALDVISANDSFGNFNATLLATGWGDPDQAGIPVYAWGINANEAANRSHIFPSAVIRCADCTGRTASYVAQLAGAHHAALLGYGATENSKVCAQTSAESITRYGDDIGAQSVYLNDELDYGLPGGIAPEVTAMREAGVDFITTCMDLNAALTLAQELERQGMGDVPIYHPNTYDQAFVAAKEQFMQRLRAGAPLAGAEAALARRRDIVGDDPLPYGLAANRTALQALAQFAYDQRIVSRQVDPTSLFLDVEG